MEQEESTFPVPRRAHHITSHTHPVSSRPPSFLDFTLALSLQNPARGSSITLQSTNTFPIVSQQATRSFQYFITTTNSTKGPPLALSPDSIFEPLTTNLPLKIHAIFYQLSLLPPTTVHRTTTYFCSCPSPRKFPCRILGQLCDTTCISVTTTVDVRHDNRNHDDTLLLVHVSALT